MTEECPGPALPETSAMIAWNLDQLVADQVEDLGNLIESQGGIDQISSTVRSNLHIQLRVVGIVSQRALTHAMLASRHMPDVTVKETDPLSDLSNMVHTIMECGSPYSHAPHDWVEVEIPRLSSRTTVSYRHHCYGTAVVIPKP